MEVSGRGAREVRIPPELMGGFCVFEGTGALVNPHFWLAAEIASDQGVREEKLVILGGWPWQQGRPQALIDLSAIRKIRTVAVQGSWVGRWKLTLRQPEEAELLTAQSSGSGSRILRTPDRPGSVSVEFSKAGGELHRVTGPWKRTERLAGHHGPLTHTVAVAADSFLMVRDSRGGWGPMTPWTLRWTASG
ncbi:hypothetical protein [Streptomyces albipurpureus]|uniref:Uncharacterized protein n=1 Tax=Streptomyces albipurpureus TaxID=2897419 RepID=A0ABT0UTX8_9ACTN|nr:hypothetical protein [Streptomyces sp. CWNU-1]MCM2391904.1 hypothetical protein [Streptomyces sp. CWNU-1]